MGVKKGFAMKNSLKTVTAIENDIAVLLARLEDLRHSKDAAKALFVNELMGLIKEKKRSLTPEEISKMTDGELSAESVICYGTKAFEMNHHLNNVNHATMPNLKRVQTRKIHHWLEVDDEGNIIKTKDIETTRYEYYV